MAEISVIIPTHNRAHTLERAIDSVLTQEGVNFELIVVNDGSTDNTREVLTRCQDNPRLQILALPRGGVSAARNAGVSISKAPYIAFLDSDDEWLPGKLSAQMEFFQRTDFRIQQTTERWIRKGKRVNPPRHLVKKEGDLFRPSLERCMITPSSVCMTRELYDEFGGFDESYPVCEDYELWLRVTAKYPVGLVQKDYLKRYGGHADQLSSGYPALDKYRIRAMVNILEGGVLTDDQRAMVLEILPAKLTVYMNGAKKRGNRKEYEWCRLIEEKYLGN